MPNTNVCQGDEWQVQVSKRKKNCQRKQKKNQKYSSKDQLVNKNKRDNAYYYQNTKKNSNQNGNKNKNGKRSNKFESKMKKQSKGRDILLESIPIDRNKNLNIIKSTSLLKIQFERQQNSQRENSSLNKELLVPKKTISEMSDATVSVTSLASDTNSMTSSTLTQIDDQHDVEIINNKENFSDSTLLNKANDSSDEKEKMGSKLASPISSSLSPKSTTSLTVNIVNTNGIISQKKECSVEKSSQKDELIKRLESQCSISSSSSDTSYDSEASSTESSSSDDSRESDITAGNELEEAKKNTEEKDKKQDKKEEKKLEDKKEDMTKKVLEFNFKNYTDVKPFIPKHLKAQQEQSSKVEVASSKPQTPKQQKKTTTVRKTKEINKIIHIDPSCLHQKDGHIIPFNTAIINMKNGKNSAQEILQKNIQQKTNELQESKKKKYEELRKLINENGSSQSQGYQSLPIRENMTNSSSATKKTEEKVVEKPQVRKTMSNSTLEVSSVNKIKKEHQRTSSYTLNHSSSMQKNIPSLVELKDDYACHSICQLDISNRIENEYHNVKCYNDPMEQSLTRVKPSAIKRTSSIQNITTSISRKGSNNQLLLGAGSCMTITNTITTCKTTPRVRPSKSFSWLKGSRSDLDKTHVTINTTTSTSHSNTLYTNLVGTSTYCPIVLPTASVQKLSVETSSRRLRNSSSLPNIMSKLIKKLSWPFSGSGIESETPVAIDAK